MTIIAPSILSADFSRLGDDISMVEKAGAQWLHIDVMDGHFVPNITIGVPVVKSIRKTTKMVLDVHLMIENPEEYIEAFAAAGADIITVHIETLQDPEKVISLIRKNKKKAGLSLNPATPLSAIKDYLKIVDLVLIMSVNPGFGGQAFIPESLEKITALKKQINTAGAKCLIEVDGGINLETGKQAVTAGADALVAGAAVYGASDPAAVIKQLGRVG